jgi:5-methylthioadenosine/S-adenosylhomocysteine deaminase
VEYLDSLQFLNQRTVAVHSVKLSENDMEIYQERQVGVSHNPKSNLKLANGFAPISTLLQKKIKIGLGTDGAASNNGLNMYEEIGFCARIHKGTSQDPTIVTAKETLNMATIGGAEVLGLAKIIGSIEIGKRADLQIVNVHKPHLTPMYNSISHLVYAVTAADVDTVIVNGKIIMQNRQMLTIDDQEVISNVNKLAEQIKNS